MVVRRLNECVCVFLHMCVCVCVGVGVGVWVGEVGSGIGRIKKKMIIV